MTTEASVISEPEGKSNDPKAMYLWQAQWADLIPITVTPCVEDEDAGAVMASLGKR